MHRVSIALAAAMWLAPAAHAEAERAYHVAVRVTDDGQVVASPSIRLVVGGTARMEIDRLYRIEATVTEAADGKTQLVAEIARPDGAQWVVESRPRLLFSADGEATIMTGSEQWDEIQVSISPAA